MPARTHRLRRKRHSAAQRLSSVACICIGAVASLAVTAVLAVCIVANSWLQDLPEIDDLESYCDSGITTVYASDETTVLAELYLQNRISLEYDEISSWVFDATVATEDERFYEHEGVDASGVMRAIAVNLFSDDTEGASTITQQLVRNTVLLDEMTEISYKRKLREMWLAIQVEQTYSKDEILLMYLNVINFGDGNYGIETAARDYFGVSASELNINQAAMLVGIPQSPSANNPRDYYDTADERRRLVLRRMLSNGYIDQETYDKWIDRSPKLADDSYDSSDVADIAPYFVDYITSELEDSALISDAQLARGGLSIYTTLDVDCQEAAIESIEDTMEHYDDDMDASLVSIDPTTGEIVAMVGGRDYDSDQFNLATQMSRQAGSSFKTFSLLTALAEGVDPDNTFINSSSPALVGDNWEVSNSEGSGSGSMSLTAATTSSVNTVYARLVHGLGASKVVEMANSCGVTADLKPYDSIALGAQGVCVLDMASGYATIASGGLYREPTGIARVENADGEAIYTHQTSDGERVIDEAVAAKATEILETVITSGTGTGASLSSIGQEAAGKTGTSNNGRDLWFCGYTPQLATAVWAGYRVEQSTSWYGGTICAPIWQDYMIAALTGGEDGEPYECGGTVWGGTAGLYGDEDADLDGDDDAYGTDEYDEDEDEELDEGDEDEDEELDEYYVSDDDGFEPVDFDLSAADEIVYADSSEWNFSGYDTDDG